MAYAEYIEAAFKTDYISGTFWCNPVDSPKGFGKDGVKQGFLIMDSRHAPDCINQF